MFSPQVGDKVRLNASGFARFKKPLRGVVRSTDPLDETAVKVQIDVASSRPVTRTISVRHLEADNG